MGTATKERAKLLRLRNQLILNECPYLVIEKMEGRYDDALSLLIEVILDGRLPASLVPKKDWHGKAIDGTVDENETSLATADLVAWLARISPNEQVSVIDVVKDDATQSIKVLEGIEKHASLHELVHPYINTLYDNLPVEIQGHVAKEFTPKEWNAASPNWRSGWALHDDYERKTKRTELAEAMLAYGYWIKLQDQIIEIVHKIDVLKLKHINPDADINYSDQDIVRLMDELALLEEMWYQPKFSNRSPENIELEKNRGAANLEITELPEAIQFLVKNTGALWTEDQLLSFVSKFQIILYAHVPPWTPINIIRHNSGGLFSRYYIEPGRNLMAILDHRLIESIWITGKANATSACYTPPSSNSDLILFTKPVQVNRRDVRLTTEIMLRILKEWESIQRFGAPILQTIQMPIEALPGPVTLAMPTLQSAEMQVTPVFASTPAETHAAPAGEKLTHVPLPIQRTSAQDDAIIAEIIFLGFNPLKLPAMKNGTAGMRATVSKSMKERNTKAHNAIFASRKVYETAWQRMRNDGNLRDEERPLPDHA